MNENLDKEIEENNDEVEENVDSSIEESDSQEDETDDLLGNETFTYSIDNNNVKNDYNRGSYNEKTAYIYIAIGAFVLIFIIGLLIYFVNKGSKNNEFSKIESKLVSGAKKYYDKYPDSLPLIDGGFVSISADDLIENSFLKPFSEMVSSDTSCSGYVNVYNVNGNYAYFPYLNCGEKYKSVVFSKKLTENVVTSGDGLYKVGNEFIFRGDYPNNYVKFNDKTWRILRINADGSIRLFYVDKKAERVVWDDRYNADKENYVGINNYRVSRLLEYLNKSYDDNTFVSEDNKGLLVKHDWCIGKVSEQDVLISNLNLCSDVYNESYIGALQIDDVLIPSLDQNCKNVFDYQCTNYNYLYEYNSGWTINASSDRSYIAFSSSEGAIDIKNASSDSYVRPVINVNGNILFKDGDGTLDNPYIIGE